MKRSIWALINALLVTSFPLLMFWSVIIVGKIKAYDSDGMNWGLASYLVMMTLVVLLFGIMGIILSWVAYLKNNPPYIIYTIFLMGTIAAFFFPFPNQMIIPVLLAILGFIAYLDMKKISKKE